MRESIAAPSRSLWRSDRGVTSLEYALMGSLVSIVIVGGALSVGGTVTNTFELVLAAFTSGGDAEEASEDGGDSGEGSEGEGSGGNNFPDPCQQGGTNCGHGNGNGDGDGDGDEDGDGDG